MGFTVGTVSGCRQTVSGELQRQRQQKVWTVGIRFVGDGIMRHRVNGSWVDVIGRETVGYAEDM